MWKEFRAFIMRGNVLDLAIGVIIGSAFGAIVTSLVNDIIMPPIGLLTGRVNFTDRFISLNGQAYATLAEAQAATAPTLNYGLFLNALLNFLLVAVAVFFLVQAINRLQKPPDVPPSAPSTKDCPFCYSVIPIKATRCPQCTSELKAAA